ncbi:hypothetical protein RJ639_046626 [Escallonia herrerae]|uniref:DUF7866 domain-containing protein n=1 Tax=Escallonia herrerae TaxID=1293975 RepID=A0AA88W5E1_9ASTE|nr:hypothetical protein RJ639_046626 [Escallonia herrerae]
MNHLALRHADTRSLILVVLIAIIIPADLHAVPAGQTPINAPPLSMVVGAGITSSSRGELKPAGTTEYRMPFDDHLAVVFADGNAENRRRRKLAQPFQLCLVCRCCVAAADPTSCANMPCCFGIDCQLPNKPFGVCAFVPKICNCTSCAV